MNWTDQWGYGGTLQHVAPKHAASTMAGYHGDNMAAIKHDTERVLYILSGFQMANFFV